MSIRKHKAEKGGSYVYMRQCATTPIFTRIHEGADFEVEF
jgi:hypothetical protein